MGGPAAETAAREAEAVGSTGDERTQEWGTDSPQPMAPRELPPTASPAANPEAEASPTSLAIVGYDEVPAKPSGCKREATTSSNTVAESLALSAKESRRLCAGGGQLEQRGRRKALFRDGGAEASDAPEPKDDRE